MKFDEILEPCDRDARYKRRWEYNPFPQVRRMAENRACLIITEIVMIHHPTQRPLRHGSEKVKDPEEKQNKTTSCGARR